MSEKHPFEAVGHVWFVTPALEDARKLHFGPPQTGLIETLGDAWKQEWGYPIVDRAKVELYKLRPDILAQPILLAQRDGENVVTVLDGRHRLTALIELGRATYQAYVIPDEKIWAYYMDQRVLGTLAEWVWSEHRRLTRQQRPDEPEGILALAAVDLQGPTPQV
jgi:hypothetical protein